METEYVDIAEACAIAIAECLYPANSRARTDKLGASYLAILKYEEGEFARIHKKVVLRKSSDLAWQLEGS